MLVYDSWRCTAGYQLLLTMNSCLEMPWRWWFWPNFDNISTRHPVSSKLSTTLVRAYMTLVQWAWNFRLLGRSFRGTSLNDLKCLWWLGYASKNLHNAKNLMLYWDIWVCEVSGYRYLVARTNRGLHLTIFCQALKWGSHSSLVSRDSPLFYTNVPS
jgi:hypothetical protein